MVSEADKLVSQVDSVHQNTIVSYVTDDERDQKMDTRKDDMKQKVYPSGPLSYMQNGNIFSKSTRKSSVLKVARVSKVYYRTGVYILMIKWHYSRVSRVYYRTGMLYL